LLDAATPVMRQRATLSAADHVRRHLVDREALRAALGSPHLHDDDKTALIGALVTLSARTEILLGRAYVGGSRPWESTNLGVFPEHYQARMGCHGWETPAAWCTAFAGTAYEVAGFRFADHVSFSTARSVFWSGYRLDLWAREGKANDGALLQARGERLADQVGGSRYVPGKTWAALHQALTHAPSGRRQDTVKDWLSRHLTPAPGDVIVLDEGNRIAGGSHTVLVAGFDPSTTTLTTLEGNVGNRANCRRLDLSDPGATSRIAMLGRLGASLFDGYGAAAGTAAQGIDDHPLLVAARQTADDLFLAVSGQAWVTGARPSAPPHQWDTAGHITSQQTWSIT
jgi:hypothetical protein